MDLENLAALVRRAQDGDDLDARREAWNALFLRFMPELVSPDWPDASTALVLGVVWERGWRGIRSFRGGATPEQTALMLRGWLRQIVRTTKINAAIRQPLRQRHFVPLDDSASPDMEPADGEDSIGTVLGNEEEEARLRSAVSKLSPQDQQRLELVYVEGHSVRQAAKILGCDESTLRHHLGRIFGHLRAALEKHLPCPK